MKHINEKLDSPYIWYHVPTKAHENPSTDSQVITESTTRTQYRLSVGWSTVFWKLRLCGCMKIIIRCHRHAKWG